MEPYLSLASSLTGSGSRCPQPALDPAVDKVETAHAHSPTEKKGMSKREAKAFLKQHCENLEEIRHKSNMDNSEDPAVSDSHQSFEEVKGEAPAPFTSDKAKRRKITEDSEEWIIPDIADFQMSTQSNSDKLRKIRSHRNKTNKEDFDLCFDEQASPKSECQGEEHQPSSKEGLSEASNTLLDQKLSKKSSSGDSIVTSFDDAISAEKVLLTAQALCSALKGRLLSSEVLSGRGGNSGLSFECCNHHQFIVSLSTLNRLKVVSSEDRACRDSWCLKCRNFLQKTVQRAESLNSRVLSACLSRGCVEIECEHLHRFTVNYTKNHSKTWCEECRNDQQKQRQQQWEDRAKAEEQRKQQEQKRLFEESLRHMQEQQRRQEQQFASQQEATYFEDSLKHIVYHAKRKMEKEMSNPEFHGECNHVEIFNVYKILYMPLNLLIKTLTMIDRSQLSSQYRQLALLLHPDKNKHKLANEAFLKLSQAYEMCKRLI